MKRLLTILFVLFCRSFIVNVDSQTIEPLVQAEFDQNKPFNDSCPGNSLAGCGPTAIAQILTRYKTPAGSVGTASYKYAGETVEVTLDGISFDWDNILDRYTKESYNSVQAKAVADLVYACGAAMNVTYGKSSTSVTNYARMLFGLQHNLHFSVDARYLRRVFYSTAEWIEMINEQLKEKHPVFYRGTWFFKNDSSDHMFLIDGLDEKGFYHVNFGKSGSGNKFACLDYLNQSGTNPGNRGVCWNTKQVMFINSYPTPEFNDYPEQVCISEEPIILNKDTMLHSVTLDLGTSFTLSCRLRNCSNEKASIYFGWALVKDGQFIKMLNYGSYGLNPGNTFKEASHLTVKLPTDLVDGEYTLQLYHKLKTETDWREVWQCAPTKVDVAVNKGRATITPPDNHLRDPELYLKESIVEIDNAFKSVTNGQGRVFELQLGNNTTNNYEGAIKLELVADGKTYEYETTQAVYSQTHPVYQILIPTSAINLEGKNISTVRAYYFYSGAYHLIGIGESSTAVSEMHDQVGGNGDLKIYSVNGLLLKTIKATDISYSYNYFLNSLPKGIYIIKEGKTTRKIILH